MADDAAGTVLIRVDSGVKHALQTLLQVGLDGARTDEQARLVAHLPKILPDKGHKGVGCVVGALLRHAGYNWSKDGGKIWLTANPEERAEHRRPAGPSTSRAAEPRATALQQLPINLEHEAGATNTEATRAADAARPPPPRVMPTVQADKELDKLRVLGSGWGAVARPLGAVPRWQNMRPSTRAGPGRCRDGPTDSLLPGVRCQTRQLGAQGF